MDARTLQGTVESLEERHGKEVMQIASMKHLTRNALKQYSITTGVDLSGTLKTLDQCIESHLIDRDIHPHALAAAVTDLQEVGAAAMR